MPAASRTSSINRFAVGSSRWSRGLVEHEHRRAREGAPGEDDPLALAAGDPTALLTDRRVPAFGQLLDPVPDPRPAERLLALCVTRAGPRKTDVLADRGREQVRVLSRDGNRSTDVFLPEVAQVSSGERHPALLGIEEAKHQVRHGRLPGPTRTDQGDAHSGVEAEAEPVERGWERVPRPGSGLKPPSRRHRNRPRRKTQTALPGSVIERLAPGQLQDPPPCRKRLGQLARHRFGEWLNRLERSQGEQGEHRDQDAGRGGRPASWASTETARTPTTVAPVTSSLSPSPRPPSGSAARRCDPNERPVVLAKHRQPGVPRP